MYQETIYHVRNTITVTFDTMDGLFDLPSQTRAYKPFDQGWSIDEILEHVTLTNHFLMIVIKNGRDKVLKRILLQPIEHGESDLESIIRISDPDAFSWIRPEHMEPTRQKSSDEIRHVMQQQRRECLEILDQMTNGEGSLHKVRMSVQNLGKLDMYQWLFFLTQHTQRHITEIRRIRIELKVLYAD